MDLISGRIDAPIKDLGTLKLRNISRPVHAYMVGAGKRPRSTPAIDSFQRRRPSIAVLPFLDQSAATGETGETAGTATSYFSDGLVEDIISALSCLPELVVISRTSTLRYRGAAPDPRQIRRDLACATCCRAACGGPATRCGCRPSWRTASAAPRCGATASPATRPTSSSCRTSFRRAVVATITPQVQEAELRRALRKRPENLDAYECVMRGLDLLYRFEDNRYTQALPLFQRAMALDPHYATAHALAASWYSVRNGQGQSPNIIADLKEADRLARMALSLDRFDPRALSLCGHVRALLFRDYDHAIELFDRALAANPSSAIAWMRSSATFSYMGETREARRRADFGLRLSPYDANVFYSYSTVSLASYVAGDYDDAVLWARKSAALNPHFTANLRFLAASLAASGRIDEARQVSADLLRVHPQFNSRRFAEAHALRDPDKRRLFGDHLVLAGLPE